MPRIRGDLIEILIAVREDADLACRHYEAHRSSALVDDHRMCPIEEDAEPVDVPPTLGDEAVSQIETKQIGIREHCDSREELRGLAATRTARSLAYEPPSRTWSVARQPRTKRGPGNACATRDLRVVETRGMQLEHETDLSLRSHLASNLMRRVGLEPTSPCGQRLLRPPPLPVWTPPQVISVYGRG
jgi:hypothetical protein